MGEKEGTEFAMAGIFGVCWCLAASLYLSQKSERVPPALGDGLIRAGGAISRLT